MIDKVQKIKNWISKEQEGLMNAQGNFEYPEHEGAYHVLCNLDSYIDSLQEEPIIELPNTESMIESYKQRLISQANGVKNSPLVDMCLVSYKHGINETLDILNLSNVQRTTKDWKEERVSKNFEMALAEMVAKAQKCVVEPWVVAAQWKDELIKLAKSEEPVSIWHDASEEPDDMSHCLIFYGCKESVGHYLHYEPVLYNKKEKVFVTPSFPHPTGYKVEQKSFDGGCVAEVYKNRRDRISISDITQWCYLYDLHKLSNVGRNGKNWKEEPVSEINKVVQVRRCLEEVATTINPFVDEVIEQFNLKDKSIVAKEIQYRGVGLKGDFHEEIHRSDDEVIYILKEDKTVGLVVIRRTEFNNAEITMVKTEERFKEKKQ